MDELAGKPPTPLAASCEPVTARSLFAEHLRGRRAAAVGHGRRSLMVGGVAVASVGADPSQITPLCALSGVDLPIFDVLAGLAAQHPTGVLIIEADHGSQGFAFSVRKGRIVGARGPAAIDELGAFILETRRMHPQRLSATQGPERVARVFVHERALDHLDLARRAGARMTFVRGDIAWLGPRIADESGIAIEHLLLEHARRHDESPRIRDRVGPLSHRAMPLRALESRDSARRDSHDADDATMSLFADAQTVFSLCDGKRSVDQVVHDAMLGTFRGLAGMAFLIARSCVQTDADDPIEAPFSASTSSATTPRPQADVIKIRDSIATPLPNPRADPTQYSYVKRKDTEPPKAAAPGTPPTLAAVTSRGRAPNAQDGDTQVIDVPLPPSASISQRPSSLFKPLSVSPPPVTESAPSRRRGRAILWAMLTAAGIVFGVALTGECQPTQGKTHPPRAP